MSQVSTFTLCSSSILVLPQADAAHLHYCISVYLDAVILRQCYTGLLLLHTAQIQSLQSFRLGNYLMFTTESPSKYQVGQVLVESLSQCVVQGYHSLPAFLFYVLPLKKLTKKRVCVGVGTHVYTPVEVRQFGSHLSFYHLGSGEPWQQNTFTL